MAEKMSMDDEQIIGITKLKLHPFSLAALEIILGATVVEVRSMMERTSIQTTAVDVINIRVYLRTNFTSSRSDNHTICDSKHCICC